MNYENGDIVGVVRFYGVLGVFVFKWIIERSMLVVFKGEDLIKKVWVWNCIFKLYCDFNVVGSIFVVMVCFCSVILVE